MVVLFMFVGFTLRFLALPSSSGGLRGAVVSSELFKVYGRLFGALTEPPPLPSLDLRTSILLLFVGVLGWAISADVDVSFRALGGLWDVLLFVWDTLKDFAHVAVFLLDTFLPLYNWLVTLWYQLTDGTFAILTKCQVRGVMEGASNIGDAMVHLSDSIVTFVADPKGPLDVYNVTLSLQDAFLSQESALECACDGLSPVFLILLDSVRSRYLGNVVNESVNVFIGFFQTLVLAVPPFGEILSFSRMFGPLQRVPVYLGKFLDEGLDGVLNRAFDGLTAVLDGIESVGVSAVNEYYDTDFTATDRSGVTLARIPVFSVFGYYWAANIGVLDMLMHTITHLCYAVPITYDPVSIHAYYMRAITSFETSLYLPLQVLTDILSVVALPKIFVASLLMDEDVELGDRFVAKSVSLSMGHALRATVGLPMAVIDMLYFVFRGEFTHLTFPQILQRMDGQFGKCEKYVTLQCDFFRHVDFSTYEAEMYWALSTFRMRSLPQLVRVASRAGNVLIRILFSIEDMVHGQFSHVAINCGYGYNKECSTDCQFYYDPDNPYIPFGRTDTNAPRADDENGVVPCNSQLSEWVLHEFYTLATSLSLYVRALRPQHGVAWCERFVFPRKRDRCARSNKDWVCATSTTIKELIDVPVNLIRHIFQGLSVVGAMDGDIFKMELDDRVCDVSELLYSIVGNVVSLIPSTWLTDSAEENLTDMLFMIYPNLFMTFVRSIVVLIRYVWGLIASTMVGVGDSVGVDVGDAFKIDWEAVQREIDAQLISDRHAFKFSEEVEAELSFDFLKESTSHFVVTEIILVFNFFINIFESIGEFFGSDNYFNVLADILGILKNGLGKAMIDIVTLHLEVLGGIFVFFSGNAGTDDFVDFYANLTLLVIKYLEMLGRVATSIVVALLKALGSVGEFILDLWRGVCSALDAIEWLVGDMGATCDAVEQIDDERRRLRAAEGFVEMPGWLGDTECDHMARHYDGRPYSDLVYLERLRVLECKEWRLYADKLSLVLRADIPRDVFYNWKRKWLMCYELLQGVFLYLQYDSGTLMREWERAGLPHYWLELWSRFRLSVPWVDMAHAALLRAVEPVPELKRVYHTARETFFEMSAVWHGRNGSRLLREAPFMVFGADFVEAKMRRARMVLSDRTSAWGLKTNIDIDGDCAVADNFFLAMSEASERVAAYYSGPYVDHVLPTLGAYLSSLKMPYPPITNSFPAVSFPSVDAIKAALMYNFEECEAYHITCGNSNVSRFEQQTLQLARVDRITQSLWYILLALAVALVVQTLLGLSLFPLYPLSVFILTAHVWNYRWTCFPNIPNCAFDDVLLWLDLFRPSEWQELFPVLHNMTGIALNVTNATSGVVIGERVLRTGLFGPGEVSCPETNALWTSAYLLSKTWLVYPLEFALWATPYKDAFNEWIMRSDAKEECLYLLGLDLIWIPAIVYAFYVLWGVLVWGVRKLVLLVSLLSDAAVVVYTLEKSAGDDKAVSAAVSEASEKLEERLEKQIEANLEKQREKQREKEREKERKAESLRARRRGTKPGGMDLLGRGSLRRRLR